ncbi:adenosine deaminase [Legionella israelensis]|uniref:adenosine deaminase n=1 Tax=Legionella israelensis TaxID=454 RepID=A0AAX1EIX0_9GAMM|nr:adenosine deaminase [Legionella israelensis]QBR85015.1 adenosine deaminase [Legionella israelensis]
MNIFRPFLFVIFLSFVLSAKANVNLYFNQIKNNPDKLHAFLKEMPKGGELHYHLDGGVLPEKMIQWAAEEHYCLQKDTLGIKKTMNECGQDVSSKQLVKSPGLYEQTVRAWSMKDFVSTKESGHDHFFNSFPKFMPLAFDKQTEILAEILKQAAQQNVLYLELMVSPDKARSSEFAQSISKMDTLAKKKQALLRNKAFLNNIQSTVAETTNILKKARQRLACDRTPKQKACKITVKFQYYVLREQSANAVFAQALNAFAAAANSSDLVAVNLVQAEDGYLSLRDYQKHMQIFQFLHQVYPEVHIALHAGELSPELVASEHLKDHVREALLTGRAERIGHGVDIMHENKAENTLNYMAKHDIAVEINLTSNREILSITGKDHPLRQYLLHHVPVVLSTDDEGVLRTDLSQQYLEAVLNHSIDYPLLKQINRNALTYSFLPGKSIWSNSQTAQPVNECRELDSIACKNFTKKSQKARLQWLLEKKLISFEQKY